MFHYISAGPGIAQLHEKCPVTLDEVKLIAPLIVITVTKVKNGPWIDLIREEKLREKMLILRIDIIRI